MPRNKYFNHADSVDLRLLDVAEDIVINGKEYLDKFGCIYVDYHTYERLKGVVNDAKRHDIPNAN